jgi:hypothetical protein
LLCARAGLSAAFSAERIGQAHSNEPGRHPFACAEHDRLLQQGARLVRQAVGSSEGRTPSAHHFLQRGLMMEATEDIGLRRGNLGESGELEGAEVNPQHGVWPGARPHGINILVGRDVPGNKRQVLKGVPLVLPHQVKLRPRFAAAPARTGELPFETLGQPQARTVGPMHAGERGKKRLITPRVSRGEVGKGRLPPVLQKGHRPLVHPLRQRFGREVDRVLDLPGFGRQLR